MTDADNTITKSLSVWLTLKSETTSGNIKSYRSKLPVLAEKSKISVAALEMFLTTLEKKGLVHIKGENLLLAKYQVLKKYRKDLKKSGNN